MSPYRIVQVSDRRLTLPGGKLYDDEANKAITVNCDDAYFALAYTGTAYMKDINARTWVRTDEWIANSLHDLMQEGYGTAVELYRAFGAHAAKTVARTPRPLRKLGVTFVFAGFFVRTHATAFVGTLSNMVSTPEGKIEVARTFDTQNIVSPVPSMPYNELELHVSGRVSALVSTDAIAKAIYRHTRMIARRLVRVQRGSGTRDDGAIVGELVKVVRMASRHPQHGKYIGRDCMGVQIRSDTPSMVTDTYKENSVEHDFPWIVSREMVATASWSVTFSHPPDARQGRVGGP
jgi:hypothetical protein